MARLPCKQSSSPSQQTRVNNFGNSRNPYWDMQQARHPAPPYVRNHYRHIDYTGESPCESHRESMRQGIAIDARACSLEGDEEEEDEKKREGGNLSRAFFESVFRIARKSRQMRDESPSRAGESRQKRGSETHTSVSSYRMRPRISSGFVRRGISVASFPALIFYSIERYASLNVPTIASTRPSRDEKLSVPFFGFTAIRIIFVINVPLCAITSRPIKDGRR